MLKSTGLHLYKSGGREGLMAQWEAGINHPKESMEVDPYVRALSKRGGTHH